MWVRKLSLSAVVLGIGLVTVGLPSPVAAETLDRFFTRDPPGFDAKAIRGPDGRVWFASEHGLTAVDSRGRTSLYPQPIPEDDVSWLGLGPDGAMWVTHSAAGRLLRVDATGVVTKVIDLKTLAWPRRAAAGPDGNLWLSTDFGLARVTLSGEIADYRFLPPRTSPWSMVAGPDDALWFTWDNGVGRITTTGTVRLWTLTTEEQLDTDIVAGPDGNLWVAGIDELEVDDDDGTLLRITPAGHVTRIFVGEGVRAVTAGPDGRMWFAYAGGVGRIATDGSGLQRWPEPFGSHTDCNEYSRLGPESLAFDATGALWTLSSGTPALVRVTSAAQDRSALEAFEPRRGALADPRSIARDAKGRVWVSGRGTIVRLFADGRRKVYRRHVGNDPGDLLPVSDGSVWYTSENGVNRLSEDGRVRRYRRGFSPRSDPSTLARGPDGSIWFVDRGLRAIGRLSASGQVRSFARGLPRTADLRDIASDGRHLWVTDSSGGLVRVSASGRIRRFTHGLGPKADPFGIVRGPDGKLWFTELDAHRIGTIAGAGRIREYPVADAPASIVPGPDGALWFTTANASSWDTAAGVGRITVDGRTDRFYAHATCTGRIRALIAGPDGKLWFVEPHGTVAVGRLSPQRLVETGALVP